MESHPISERPALSACSITLSTQPDRSQATRGERFETLAVNVQPPQRALKGSHNQRPTTDRHYPIPLLELDPRRDSGVGVNDVELKSAEACSTSIRG